MERSRRDRLFGAACLKVRLDQMGGQWSGTSSIYEGTLEDLGVSDEEVSAFLAENRKEVEKALVERAPLQTNDLKES